MPQFKFNTISRADIERSVGGNTMIQAIDYPGNNHQLITGVPGSGKTTVTIMRAERLVNLNKKIKLFTYQTLLKAAISNIASKELQPHIFGFYDWFVKIRRFGYLNPEYTEVDMLRLMAGEDKVDEILIDEGQDFEERIFRCLLPKCTQMTVGADNAQKVHDRGILAASIKTELERTKTTIRIPLEYNYRNTFELYNFARYFMPDNERANNPITLQMMPRGNGNLPVVMQVLSEDEKFAKLKVILENAGDTNIAVLLYHQAEVDFYYTKLSEMQFKCTKHHNRAHAKGDIENILITTYKSAKGLEFQVVIMPDMHTAMNSEEKTPEHYYIGCTRAKENLFLTYSGNSLPGYFTTFATTSFELRVSENVINDKKQATIFDDLPF